MTSPVSSHLRLVKSAPRVEPSAADFQVAGTQRQLFFEPKKGLLIVIYFPEVTESELRSTFQEAKPSYVFELRTAPRFDIGCLNRHAAFEIFENQNARYLDVSSSLMGKTDRTGLLTHLKDLLRDSPVSSDRPLVFLVSRNESDQNFVGELIQLLSEHVASSTELYEVPHYSSSG